MIDWSRVDELKQEFGEDAFGELIGLFLDEMQQGLDALIVAPDDQLEAQFHGLKGSALNMGLSDLAAHCQQGEVAARTGALSDEAARTEGIFAASRQALLQGI